jgi:hypothetical protein
MEAESFWRARLAWRFRGALLWPLFVVLTLAEGVLLTQLPVAGDGGTPFPSGALLAGCLNLVAVAALGPLLAVALRRRRRDLPKVVAQDHAGTAMLVLVLAGFVVAGVLHAPERADAERDYAAQAHAALAYVRTQAPAQYRDRLGEATTIKMEDERYRTCVPGDDPDRWFCVLVSTDTSPPGVEADPSHESNLALKPYGDGS